MGDRPVYTCRCHVFRIDSTTKKTWIPAADGPATVSFFYDPSKRAYRVVSIDNGKPVINSTIVAGMTFSRTAQKFGQWSDQRANTVYGVGFSNEDELTKFADQFEEAKVCVARDTLSPVSPPPALVDSQDSESRMVPPARVTSPSLGEHPNNPSFDTDREPVKLTLRSSLSENGPDRGNENGVENLLDNLRIDNERLKTSLNQSQSNLKKWEIELHTLRTNNSRLQSALHENSRNIEEWKNQLLQYREENGKLRSRNEELEIEVENISRGNATQSPKMNKKPTKSTLKSEEVERVKQILEKVTAELVEAKEENCRLKTQLRNQDGGQNQHAYENSMVCQLQADMEIRLRDLVDMNRKLLTYCRKS